MMAKKDGLEAFLQALGRVWGHLDHAGGPNDGHSGQGRVGGKLQAVCPDDGKSGQGGQVGGQPDQAGQ